MIPHSINICVKLGSIGALIDYSGQVAVIILRVFSIHPGPGGCEEEVKEGYLVPVGMVRSSLGSLVGGGGGRPQWTVSLHWGQGEGRRHADQPGEDGQFAHARVS